MRLLILKYMRKHKGDKLFSSLDAHCIGKNSSDIVIALMCVALRRLNYKSLRVLVSVLQSVSREDLDEIQKGYK